MRRRSVNAEPDTPLLYVLRNDLELNGAKFGCGLSQCGACTVLVDGVADALLRDADRQRRAVRGDHARRPRHRSTSCIRCSRRSSTSRPRNAATALNGMIMAAKALLDRNPRPTEAQVRDGLAGNLCRCGSHNRIVRAVLRAAQTNGRI